MFCSETDGGVLIRCKIFPNAQKNEIVEARQDELIIKINSIAEGGKANKELVKLLSKTLKIPKSSIIIKSGELNRHKVLFLPTDQQAVRGLIDKK